MQQQWPNRPGKVIIELIHDFYLDELVKALIVDDRVALIQSMRRYLDGFNPNSPNFRSPSVLSQEITNHLALVRNCIDTFPAISCPPGEYYHAFPRPDMGRFVIPMLLRLSLLAKNTPLLAFVGFPLLTPWTHRYNVANAYLSTDFYIPSDLWLKKDLFRSFYVLSDTPPSSITSLNPGFDEIFSDDEEEDPNGVVVVGEDGGIGLVPPPAIGYGPAANDARLTVNPDGFDTYEDVDSLYRHQIIIRPMDMDEAEPQIKFHANLLYLVISSSWRYANVVKNNINDLFPLRFWRFGRWTGVRRLAKAGLIGFGML